MRVAALYDIHANLPALEAVLQEVLEAGVDQLVIGGDVFPGPMPVETLGRLQELSIPVRFIQGNGDREVLAAMQGFQPRDLPPKAGEVILWVATQLGSEDPQILESWPETLVESIPGWSDVLFCHATPRSDTEIFTRTTPEDRLRPVFEDVEAPVVVCGHTHMPFDRTVGTTRVLNAGSVGMPFGEPGADWILFAPEPTWQHTRYDFEVAADRIRKTQYPQAFEFAAHNVLQPPSEQAMLAAFAKVEIR